MPDYKVYLSSTFRDLKEYRQEVLTLFDYISKDFPITAMERYTAENSSALEKCISDVEACDLYLLLIANRYGDIPDDVQLNPHHKSYTELEFETALRTDKVVLVFLANTQAEGVVFAEDDGTAKEEKKLKLEQFKERVLKMRMPPQPFTQPEELVTLISASLIKLINTTSKTEKKILDENLKYCCDRNKQYVRFEERKMKGESIFHALITNGHMDDSGGNLVNRCALFSLKLNEAEILTIAFDEFYHFSSYEENKDNFFRQLQKKFFAREESVFTSPSRLIQSLNEKAGNNLVVKMNCSEEFLSDDKIDFLSRLFIEFHHTCNAEQLCKRLYFFLNVEDAYDDAASAAATDAKLNKLELAISRQNEIIPADTFIVFLPRFELANREHIEIWIQNYLTKDESKTDDLFDEHFAALPSRFRMRLAEKQIRDLYKRIKQNDPKILDILNS